ncbi:hypothetical protein SAMN02745911_1217 [Aureimonas altamirensis DSM 21988]|nr:tape measure protein [Aureimonas altamirensis]SHI80311.1 hypothetical protein SAMN02745911_1217 [Aureimonas altamirensis DSM 21988]
MIVDELIAVLGFDLKGEGDLKRFNDGLDKAEHGARAFAGSLAKVGLVVAGAFAAIGGANALGRMGGDFLASLVQTGAQFEKLEATLTVIEGSSERAAQAMAWIREFAVETPYELAEVSEAFVRMRAYGLDPMDGSFKNIGDAASAMGKSLMDGVEAIADAVTGENERLKSFGVRASVEGEQITYRWTQNGQEMSKTVRKNSTEITAALMEIFGRFDGAMEAQGKTWEGLTARMSDNWQSFLQDVNDSGYYDSIKRRLETVLDVWQGWERSGAITRVAQGISGFLVGSMNTAAHLATQAYRIGAGFFYAARGIVDLTSKVTGLSRSMAAAGLGIGLIASSALGRGALIALAKRVPMIAALFVLDDLMSGLAGDRSVIGSLEGGEEALQNIREAFTEITSAADELATAINEVFGVVAVPGQGQLGALIEAFKGLVSSGAVRLLNNIADGWRMIIAVMRTWFELMTNPEAVFTRFADAAIAQIDRIVAAIDEATGGLITKFRAMFGAEPVAQEAPNPGVRVGGGASRSRAPVANFEPDAGLVRDGMVQAEGMRAEYGVGEDRMIGAAQGVAGFLSKMNTAASINGAIDALRNFMEPATQARRAMDDLERGVMAKIDADITPLTTKIAAAKAAIEGLRTAAASLGASPRGLSVPPARIATGAAQP